jgi:acetate kinase
MRILTVNAGSSSVRLAAFVKTDTGMEKRAGGKYDLEESPQTILKQFVSDNGIHSISVIAHRVVHGGTRFVNSCFIDADVEAEIDRLSRLAPLHNPFALKWIRECVRTFGERIPETAAVYALPGDLCRQHGIRRYGFHGLAHGAMLRRWKELRPDLQDGGRVISLQLGAGCSVTAVRNGKVMDTSMGFSPLEGLVMATRSGDIDPGIIFYLRRSCGLTFDEIETMLNHASGLLGISGISSDMKALIESASPGAGLAVELFCYRARKYIGAYLAVLQGADAILFGGGVGENSPRVRSRILQEMQWLGIIIDTSSNNATIGEEGCISPPGSETAVWVIPADEASVLAREAIEVMERH